jgi:cell division protein FtsZ
MKDAVPALIGVGRGSGERRATDAAREAIASPLLEHGFAGARGILFNVAGPADLRLGEVRQAADEIREHADDDANIIFGASFDESLGEDVLVTLIATGLNGHARKPVPPVRVEAPVAELPAPIAQAPPPPKRPRRPVTEAMTANDVFAVMGDPNEAGRPTVAVDDDDLEVPSFLRRRGQRVAP